MVEFSTSSNKIVQIIEYPEHLQPCRHCCCKYKDKIYLIDGEHNAIIIFNPSTKTFTNKLYIPYNIGMYPSAVAIYDKIHIFNGSANTKHLIYDITNNTIKSLEDKQTTEGMTGVAVLKYNKNKIIRFGGVGIKKQGTFMISDEIKKNDNKPIKWSIKPKFKLIDRNPWGYVIYKQYIITFGGGMGGIQFNDKIYLLDLENDDNGWMEVKHIKCPFSSRFVAVLNDYHVHIFSELGKWPNWEDSQRGHYSVPISTILGSKFSF